MRVSINAVVEITAVLLIVAFWAIVWWPGILPTVAAAGLAWSRSNA